MSEDAQIVRSFYDDISNFIDALDADIEWHEMEGIAYGGVYTSAAAVMENIFKHVAEDWEDFGATPDTILAANDDWVAAMGRYHGRYKPTGKTLDCGFAHFFQLRNRKVIRFHQYTDSAFWNEVMS